MFPRIATLILTNLLFLSLVCLADTYVQGDVYGLWTVAGSPYIVQDDIQVPSNQTLTIEPGVEVRFLRTIVSDPLELAVYGILYANGEDNQNIIFTANAEIPQSDHWDGIKFLSVTSSVSEVSYCEIRYAKWGIYISNCSPLIHHNEIFNGYSDGVYILGTSNPIIMYNLIRDYNYRGIKVEDTAAPILYNNTIVQNGSYGMYFCESCAPEAYNNIVWGNTGYGVYATSSTSPSLRYNDVYNNTPSNYSGVSPGTGSISADPAFVSATSNDFHLNSWSPCIDAGDPGSPLDPDGTRADMGAFYYNQPPMAPVIISIPDTTGIANFYYSYDVNATGVPAPQYSLTQFPTNMTIDQTTGLIEWWPEDSQIGDNPVTVLAVNTSGQDQQSFTIHIEQNFPPEITYFEPQTLDTVDYGETIEFNVVAFDSNAQTLTYIWYFDANQIATTTTVLINFGSTGQHTVKAVVTDGVLSDSVVWEPFVPGTEISGELSGTLLSANNPYYMIDDVNVISSDTLVIEAGVIVKVLRPSPVNSLQFTVGGKLDIDGVEDNPVIFTPQAVTPSYDHWIGFLFTSTCDPTSHLTYCEIDHAYKGVEITGASATVSYCKIKLCSSRGISVMDNSTPVIHHNSLWMNVGKGIYTYNCDSTTIYNNTIVQTTGSGLYISGTSDINIYNNISVFNSEYGIYKGTLASGEINYNDAYGNTMANYSGTPMGTGGISLDPWMENYTLGLFELLDNSPCIDAGDPYSGLDPDGTFPEMGRYYFPQSPSVPTISGSPDTINIAGFSYSYSPTISGVPWPTMSLVYSPPEMTVDPMFGTIEFLAAPGDTGTYFVDLAASNSQGAGHQTWNLHVHLNQAPVISDFWPEELDTALYHQEILFGVYAFDPDSHTVTYSWELNGTPIGTNINELTIVSEAFGNNQVKVTVSDGVDYTQHIWNYFIRGCTINGAVSGVWTPANSPYVAMSNIRVEATDSLIINPGVNVFFAGNYTFTVYGYIQATGTYENMVVFNSNELAPQPDDWDAIIIEATSNDNSHFTYCDIRHGHNGIKVFYANPTIDHCIFAYNGNYGIQLDHSASEIYNITSTHNQYGGIYCNTANAIINNSIVAFNLQRGIVADYSNPVLSYNDVYYNNINYSGCSMGWGSITADPLFISFADFHLNANSPCINVGDPNRPNDPDGTRSDMGALYYCASEVQPPEIIPVPAEYRLKTAYPNPFNASTAIEYWLPVKSRVGMTIYSVLGTEVAELVNEVQNEGYYTFNWNAGKDLSSGLYFCKLIAVGENDGREFSAVNKLLLIK